MVHVNFDGNKNNDGVTDSVDVPHYVILPRSLPQFKIGYTLYIVSKYKTKLQVYCTFEVFLFLIVISNSLLNPINREIGATISGGGGAGIYR